MEQKPQEIACRRCAAQPNQDCFDGWKFDLNTQSYVKNYREKFHEERSFDAGVWDSSGTHVSKEEFAKALEELI